MNSLLRSLGCSENERLTVMTEYAIKLEWIV